MDNKIIDELKNASPEEATELRKLLRGKSKYQKKDVYREKENKLRYLDPDEFWLFVNSIKPSLQKYYWVLYLTGLRYKEAKHVTANHIDWKNRAIIIFKAKGGFQRNANFSTYGKHKLVEYFKGRDKDKPLDFPTIQHLRRVLQETCKKHRFKWWQDLSVHNIRKSHENALLAVGVDKSMLTAHMGHTPKTAQEHYISSVFIKDKKQLKKLESWFGDIFGV